MPSPNFTPVERLVANPAKPVEIETPAKFSRPHFGRRLHLPNPDRRLELVLRIAFYLALLLIFVPLGRVLL